MDKLRPYLRVSPEVRQAVEQSIPLVALETSDLAFHLPFPRNVEATLAMREAIRRLGAVPADTAVLGGQLCLGLEAAEVEQLGRRGPAVAKASRRDLPLLAAAGADGATTAAAAMVVSTLAGARVLATGGIGGVSALNPLDVSPDLEELAQTGMLVVCAGLRPALDAAATLEVLETRGVPVLGYGSDTLPTLYGPASALPVDGRVDSPARAAAVLDAKQSLGLRGGVLVMQPPPPGETASAGLEEALAAAQTRAREEHIRGQALSAYLAGQLRESTGGQSAQALALALPQNARLAAEIALELAGT